MSRQPAKRFSGFHRTISEHRRLVAEASSTLKPANIPEHILTFCIPESNNDELSIYQYCPPSLTQPYRTTFFIPGTAFVARETTFTQMICSHLAANSDTQVIVLTHRLAPEHQFPAPQQDCYLAFDYAIQHINIDTSHLTISGYSVGATFAVGLTQYATSKGYAISQLILCSPVIDFSRSQIEFKRDEDKDEVISEAFITWMNDHYIPNTTSRKHPKLSPYYQSHNTLSHLPLTTIVFAQYDRLKSDSVAFMQKLAESKVNVRAYMALSTNHSYMWYELNVILFIAKCIRNLSSNMPNHDRNIVDYRLFEEGKTNNEEANDEQKLISKL